MVLNFKIDKLICLLIMCEKIGLKNLIDFEKFAIENELKTSYEIYEKVEKLYFENLLKNLDGENENGK